MPRNVTIQVLRGTEANLPALASGELYFGTDTGNLFLGTPGVGLGYIQVADMSKVKELLEQILMEIRASRLALTQLACEGGKAHPDDFQPEQIVALGADDSSIQ